MDWNGGKSDRYALVTIRFRSGEMENYTEVIVPKTPFVNNNHVQLMNMVYGGVDGADHSTVTDLLRNTGTMVRTRYPSIKSDILPSRKPKLSRSSMLPLITGAESWQGVSLAGGVDEIEEMLKRKAETFEALPYGNLYGACLLPDGSCMETSLDTCNLMGGVSKARHFL